MSLRKYLQSYELRQRPTEASLLPLFLGACKGIRLHHPWPEPRALTRMIIARSHAQRRDWPQRPRHLRQATALGTRPHQATALGAQAREPTQWPHASLRATCLPAFLRRLHPETTRRRSREPRDHAAPSDRRITTRRRLAGGVRQPRDQRHSVRGANHASVRGAIHASIRGAISARVPPSSRTRDQHNTTLRHTPLRTHNIQARTSPCTRRGTRARTRRSTPAINYWQQPLREPRDTNPPPGPAGGHACSAGSFRTALPLRARERERDTLQAHTRATRAVRSRACSNDVPAERRAVS